MWSLIVHKVRLVIDWVHRYSTYASEPGVRADHPLAVSFTGMTPVCESRGANMVVSFIAKGLSICSWKTLAKEFPVRFSMMYPRSWNAMFE
jgi:hypothetical protein